MPATFKITLSHKPNADGLHEVWLRITAFRKPCYASTGIAVAAKQWNPTATLEKENWIKSGNREATQHNADLVQILSEAKQLAKANPAATAAELKQLFLTRHAPAPKISAAGPDVVSFLRHSLETVDRLQFKRATYEARAAVINKFAEWRGPLAMQFAELNEEAIAAFDAWLKAKPNNPTTRKKNLKTLRLYIKRAIKLKLMSRDDDPLEDYVMPKAKPKRVWLTEKELAAYERVHLPPMQHLARLTYLMCFYLHGSRVGAVLRLKWRDRQFGRVYFTMDKGDTEKSVAESPQLTAILDSLRPEEAVPHPETYILPWLNPTYEQLTEQDRLQQMKRATSALNKNIRMGTEKCGILKKISTHSSRRTLATEADREHGGDLGKVGSLLGHQQRSTTEIYVDRYNSAAVDETANSVYKNRPMPRIKAG
jgi:integrase/recombinase XerD